MSFNDFMDVQDQSNKPPIPASSSSSFGGSGLGSGFFLSAALLSAFLSATGAAVVDAEVGAGPTAAGELPAKLKKELMSLPSIALANSLGQNDSTFTPEETISLLSLSPIY